MADQEREVDASAPPAPPVGAVQLIAAIRPLLAGQPQPVIGVTLAHLTALYVIAHAADTQWKTMAMREAVIEMHLKMVRQLMPAAEKMVMEQIAAAANVSQTSKH
jgi:hypothetical protein